MRTSQLTFPPVRRIGAALVLLTLFLSPLRAEELSITIQCSPSTVVMHAVRSGDWFTVHTDIPFRMVAPRSVELVAPEGRLSAAATFADDRGNLVAKFKMNELKPLLELPTSELTLTGWTFAGDEFAGTSTVRVVTK